MNNQKLNNILKDPNTNWKYIAIVVVVGLVALTGILVYQNFWPTSESVSLLETPITEKETPEVLANWETYKNEKYRFEISYPSGVSAKNWASQTPNFDLLVYIGENKDIGDGAVFIGIEKGVNTLEQKSFFPLATQIKDLEDIFVGAENYKAKRFFYKGPAHEMPGEKDFVEYFIEDSGHLYYIHYDRSGDLGESVFNQILSTLKFLE